MLRLHEHPKRLGAEADGQARSLCDGMCCSRSSYATTVGLTLRACQVHGYAPSDLLVLVKGYELCATKLCQDLVNGVSCIEVEQGLGH